jgi:hypothetical protein
VSSISLVLLVTGRCVPDGMVKVEGLRRFLPSTHPLILVESEITRDITHKAFYSSTNPGKARELGLHVVNSQLFITPTPYTLVTLTQISMIVAQNRL